MSQRERNRKSDNEYVLKGGCICLGENVYSHRTNVYVQMPAMFAAQAKELLFLIRHHI